MKLLLLIVWITFSPRQLYSQEEVFKSVNDTIQSVQIDSSRTSFAVVPQTTKPVTIIKSPNSVVAQSQPKKPELFNSGFIDFQNSGQMNASARVFKIYIGEPGKFMLPISVYSGVSGNNTNAGNAAARGSEPLVLGLINPMSGMFNLSIDNTHPFKKKAKGLTSLSYVYQAGQKMLSAQTIASRSFTFFSTFANVGILLKTGAWEKDKEKNMGVFWLLVRGHVVQTNNTIFKLSGYTPDTDFFKGYSVGVGIEINNVLNIKSYYYHYLQVNDAIFNIPIYQLSFNYSMKN